MGSYGGDERACLEVIGGAEWTGDEAIAADSHASAGRVEATLFLRDGRGIFGY